MGILCFSEIWELSAHRSSIEKKIHKLVIPSSKNVILVEIINSSEDFGIQLSTDTRNRTRNSKN